MISFGVVYLIPLLFGVVALALVSFCGGAVYGKAEAVRRVLPELTRLRLFVAGVADWSYDEDMQREARELLSTPEAKHIYDLANAERSVEFLRKALASAEKELAGLKRHPPTGGSDEK